jgi:Flp pilus assembly protein TadB
MINRNKSLVIEVVLIGFIAANDKGVSLIEFLKDQIEYIRERKNIENYIKVLSSGPKYTSYIIMFIPLVSIIIIALINKNFVEILFSRIGLLFLTYAVVSYGIVFFLIDRIVNFSERSRVLK